MFWALLDAHIVEVLHQSQKVKHVVYLECYQQNFEKMNICTVHQRREVGFHPHYRL